jgi:imidazolonepropionase-like amidohydrolase
MMKLGLLNKALATVAMAAIIPMIAFAAPPYDGSGSTPLALKGGKIYRITSPPIDSGTIIIRNGLIEEVGGINQVTIPSDAVVVDMAGKSILPGIIDAHSHMGVYSWPGVEANSDGNEATAPVTAQVRAEDGINLEDPAFARARAGGVTTVMVLPGSANIIGGEGVVLKLKPAALLSGMKMAEAPRQMKMAMGENPKRVYGGRDQLPSTRMGTMAKLREVFTKAIEQKMKIEKFETDTTKYEDKKLRWEAKRDEAAKSGKAFDDDEPEKPTPPAKDALSDALIDVMDGKVRVHVHCYRKDDIQDIIRISDEFGFQIVAIHHALEAYKLAEELAQRNIGVATWPDWWGFKMEAYDATPLAPTILVHAGVLTIFKSDSSDIVQRMYTEAAKGVKYGLTEDEALATITLNPAKILGIDQWVGSIEKGKQADIAVFSRSPLDIYTRVDMTFIDGRQVFDRATDEATVTHKEFAR